jgi:hypothetical protein
MHMRAESHTYVLVFWTKKDCIEFSFTLYIFLLVVVSQSAIAVLIGHAGHVAITYIAH